MRVLYLNEYSDFQTLVGELMKIHLFEESEGCTVRMDISSICNCGIPPLFHAFGGSFPSVECARQMREEGTRKIEAISRKSNGPILNHQSNRRHISGMWRVYHLFFIFIVVSTSRLLHISRIIVHFEFVGKIWKTALSPY